MKNFKQFLKEEDGMGTVEIILIIVVLIGLVVIFKKQMSKPVQFNGENSGLAAGPCFNTGCVTLESFLASLSPNLCKKEACSHQGASQL